MVRQTRRRFLEDTLLAAAAMATTPAAQVWSAEGASTSANEKLGAAVIGVGGRGVSHLDALVSRPDTEVVCIVDCDERTGQQQADQVSQRQGRRPGVYRDMREAFDDPAVDIVSTATPNHWHALVSIWAMQAGKDVYVEKPVSHNVSEGQRIVEVARKYHRICQAGTQCRSMQGTIDAVEFIRSGKIGVVNLARGLCYKRRPSIGPRGVYKPPKDVSYDLWLGPAPLAPVTRPRFHYDWHWQWAYGNGDLGNQGAHQMDIARWALGIDRLSDHVMSYGGRFGYEDAGETANTQVVLHEFGDKTLVFEVRGLVTDDYQGAKVGVIVYGTDGYVSLSSYAGGVAFDSDGKVTRRFAAGGDHFDNFIKAVRSRKVEDLHADIREGHLSSALCHLGNISYGLGVRMSADDVKRQLGRMKSNDDTLATFGRVTAHLKDNGVDVGGLQVILGPELSFDSGSETFPDHPDANRLLTRDYREPFVVPPRGQV